ncbi:MAG: hypothetical protein ABW123_27020 [Cystobacter sp.]
MTLEPTGDERSPLEPEEVRGQRVTEVVVQLPPAAPGFERCISELELGLQEGPWLQDVPAAAVAALPEFIRALTHAFRACNVPSLQSLVSFPLPRRERQVGYADAELWYVKEPTRLYKSARALSRDCRQWVFFADDANPREPKVVSGVGPSLVRVEANREGGVVYWHLGWRHGKWRLVSIEFTGFE